MAQTDARAGFRLPWSSERSNIEQTETDQVEAPAAEVSGGWPETDSAPAQDPWGMAPQDTTTDNAGWGTDSPAAEAPADAPPAEAGEAEVEATAAPDAAKPDTSKPMPTVQPEPTTVPGPRLERQPWRGRAQPPGLDQGRSSWPRCRPGPPRRGASQRRSSGVRRRQEDCFAARCARPCRAPLDTDGRLR